MNISGLIDSALVMVDAEKMNEIASEIMKRKLRDSILSLIIVRPLGDWVFTSQLLLEL